MAVDTASKRFSVLGLSGIQTLPIPDGTVAAADRLHLLMLYSGIAADVPGVDVFSPGPRIRNAIDGLTIRAGAVVVSPTIRGSVTGPDIRAGEEV